MGPVVLVVGVEVVVVSPPVVVILESNIVDGVESMEVVVLPRASCRFLGTPPLKLAVMMAMCTLLDRPLLNVAF